MRRVRTALIDDINRLEHADETVHFGLDGASYAIDLTALKAARLREVLAEYIGHARRRGPTPAERGTADKRECTPRSREIRAWASTAGIPVSTRGRIPQSVQDRYDSAGSGAAVHGGVL